MYTSHAVLSLAMFTLTLLILSSLVLAYITIVKARDMRLTRYMSSFAQKNSTLMYVYLTEGEISRAIVPHNRRTFTAVEKLLSDYLLIAHSDEIQLRAKQFAEAHFTSTYREMLQGRKWSMRMNALYHASVFGMENLQDDITRLMNSPKCTSQEHYQICKLLIHSRRSSFIQSLIRLPGDLTAFNYRQLLSMLTNEQFDEALAQFHELPVPIQHSLVEMIGILNKYEQLDFLEQQLFRLADSTSSDQSSELRIKLLKSIAQLGFTERAEQYSRFATSSSWEERAMAAKLFGALRRPELVEPLTELIKDRSWWVRTQAAGALLNMKEGKQLLMHIAEHDYDRFARDIAKETLGLHPG
ncbi:HEAT repeat domain-containing protein [Paenibacillus albus]|uniref:HEAT repeat domain-containing protein n=1 Tax=Paenibacillus albus TaxID=2495582 RepID=A0A3Q8X990_9BACL|nr:HEAT repeat domain-containing protein [Paenibacillus albus]AZN43289.1 HEAT repeat domain-containing protein [Paenibacillus albus]